MASFTYTRMSESGPTRFAFLLLLLLAHMVTATCSGARYGLVFCRVDQHEYYLLPSSVGSAAVVPRLLLLLLLLS